MTHAFALPKISFSPAIAGYLVLGVAGAAVLVWLANGGARSIASGVASIPGQAAAGVVEGIGDSLGVPRTSASECDLALREGRRWDASFACPASRFVKSLFGGGEAPAPINPRADSSGVPFY